MYLCELSSPTRLFLVAVIGYHTLPDRFAVWDLRLFEVYVELIAMLQAMFGGLARCISPCPSKDQLTELLGMFNNKCWVFLMKVI